ncbi:UNVERIFIED_CONTAM: hypothetical protein FKN15_062918 [Acipenser sinensis]
MTIYPPTGYLPQSLFLSQDTPRGVTSKYKSSAAPVPDDEVPGNSKYSARTDRAGHTRNNREQNPSGMVPARGLEKIIEELERYGNGTYEKFEGAFP